MPREHGLKGEVVVAQRGRVLVIDDERVVCNSCQRVLEQEGYEVSVATNPHEGVEKVVRENFDVALIDLRMPGLGGMDVLQAVLGTNPGLKAIIITAYSSVSTAVEAMRLGASGYLPKPFTPRELSENVGRALSAAASGFRLPLGRPIVRSEKGKGSVVASEAVKTPVSRARILLAGSDSQQMVSICQCLFSDAFKVTTAQTYEETVERIKGGQVDVLITGVDVFGVKSYELISQIRRLDGNIPVIVASADSSVELAQRLREVGIFFYLMEPFDQDEVRCAVRDAVRRAAAIRAEKSGLTIKSTCVRSIRTHAKNGMKVGFVAAGEAISENSALYREIMEELKRRSSPAQVELARRALSARELPRYIEQDHRVVLMAPFEAAGWLGRIATYSASDFEKFAPKEHRSSLRLLAYPEVLHWLRAQGVASEVRVVCLPEGPLPAEQARQAASVIVGEGLA